jgi:hypothetical protein
MQEKSDELFLFLLFVMNSSSTSVDYVDYLSKLTNAAPRWHFIAKRNEMS